MILRFAVRAGIPALFALFACTHGAPPSAPCQEPAPASRAARPPAAAPYEAFRNPDLPDEQRLDSLIAALTLDEKIDCLGTDPSVPRLGIRGSDHVEGLHGLALGGPGRWGRDDPLPTTTFPQSIGLGATWDPEIVRRAAAIEGREARQLFHARNRGGLVIRAPNADLGRDPRWGRNEEIYGEDPHLTSAMAVAFVRGLQGDDPKHWQAASLLKHFLANNNEEGRGHTSSNFDERLFHEYYAAAFRAAIQAGGSRAFMAAYNAYNGVPCTTHPMLREITIAKWGQDGIICTDAGALKFLVTDHHQHPNLAQAAAASVRAGINQYLDRYREPVQQALAQGLLREADLDQAVRRVFRVMLKLGLLDPEDRQTYAKVDPRAEPWASEEHKRAVREATRKSVVLLKNTPAHLPLDEKRLRSIAVIGKLADEVLLDWYSGTPPYTISPLQGIRERAGSAVTVASAPDDANGRAVKLARTSDVVIAVVGNHPTGDAGWAKVTRPSYGKEAVDRRSLILEDEDLIKKLRAANPRTIVVLLASFPYAINWTQDHVASIVQVTHNSQELGHALADVLFGDENPAGRLVQTWPRAIEDLPPMLDYDIRKGRTYLYAERPPLYPFGFGLSYTTFGYANLRTSADRVKPGSPITVSVDVTNNGKRAGDEVVQLYVRHLGSKVSRPRQELEGFRRVAIGAGETKTVTLPLTAEELAYYSTARGDWEVEPGEVELRVGKSSAEIVLTRRVMVAP